MSLISWSPNPIPSSPIPLRSLQLDQRLHEIYEVYHNFKRLIEFGSKGLKDNILDMDDGKPSPSPSSSPSSSSGYEGKDDGGKRFLDGWKDKVDMENITLIGHSFGGGTLLHLLQSPPPSSFSSIPIKRVIALDPWIEPLPTPALETKEGEKIKVDLLVINSEGFTLWKDHFGKVLEIVKGSGGSLVSVVGCDRESSEDCVLIFQIVIFDYLIT